MVAPDDTTYNHESQRAQYDVANPFVAFRRFADEQVSSIINFAFGSNPFSNASTTTERLKLGSHAGFKSTSDSRDQLEREAEEAAHVINLYRTAYKDAPDDDNRASYDQTSNEYKPVRCPYWSVHQEHLSAQEIQDLFTFLKEETRCAFLPQCDARTHLRPELPLSQCLGPPRWTPDVPLSYILHSPYSPLYLEQQKPFSNRPAAWRAAFQDLVSVQNGQGLTDDSSKASYDAETPLQWVSNIVTLARERRVRQIEETNDNSLGCITRITTYGPAVREEGDSIGKDREQNIVDGFTNLVFALSLGAFANTKGDLPMTMNEDTDEEGNHKDEEHDENDSLEATELELFEHLLGSRKPFSTNAIAPQSRVLAHLQHDSIPSTQQNSDKPSLLSTLTTTKKTTLLDGTTHTKIMLKKRFSDGREESTEAIHTHNSSQEKLNPGAIEAVKKQDGGQGGEKAKKGWFWS
ncbi:MAG: hypothetical protein Q9217_002067 [Psora testacea]